ncbi:sigma-70 family RNA polymerase sigma factor [Streptomyces qinzhouensis]|uniref:Sigma-70 family RNA polymerase sigma factor n=1 Tax=Streptomyces qinzhouensis TaxID=2599401 RepID=A0A5B8JD25_9ACTN|nr:sigma-70 family RNA polymerase sigma factor [Streptomyces qinzhouensis]QDY77841.1 sigma-70 family RNA polymerase sigma factor [Streptomyces qinzhouensis]
MNENDLLAARFEEHLGRLRAVAYRMLGSTSEAEDAVQEAWLRVSRAGTDEVENLGGWLTTIVSRVCLTMLSSRARRQEDSLDVVRVPDPVISGPEGRGPEHEAELADSVGLALLVVLETLAPAERLAFVLHDLFAVPFDEIAPIVDRTPAATRQLASRARRRVQGTPAPDSDVHRQRAVVDAFLAAAREGDFEGLIAVLDPDVVVRSDWGALRPGEVIRGAEQAARNAVTYTRLAANTRPALINGTAGFVSMAPNGSPFSVMAFTIRNGKIAEIDALAGADRLATVDLTVLDA